MFTRNSFDVLAIGIAVLTLNLLRSFLFLPPAIIVMDLVLFRLSFCLYNYSFQALARIAENPAGSKSGERERVLDLRLN